MPNTLKPLKISIITSSYTLDRFKDITELLDSIDEQDYDNMEVIVVCERSRELMSKIEEYATRLKTLDIKVVYNDGEWGISAARNLGIERSSGEILAFIDDDALLCPGWAQQTAGTYANDSSIVSLTGPILPLWEDEKMDWFPREFYWIFSCTYWDWTKPTEVRNGYGTNMSFRRNIFEDCGLFETNLGVKGYGKSGWQGIGGEEVEFAQRVKKLTGKYVVYHPEIKVRHRVYRYRFSNKFISRRAYYEGWSKAMFNKLYQLEDKQMLSTEYELLHRILLKLVPQSLLLLLRYPVMALKRLFVTKLVLACVAIGYFNYRIRTSCHSKKDERE